VRAPPPLERARGLLILFAEPSFPSSQSSLFAPRRTLTSPVCLCRSLLKRPRPPKGPLPFAVGACFRSSFVSRRQKHVRVFRGALFFRSTWAVFPAGSVSFFIGLLELNVPCSRALSLFHRLLSVSLPVIHPGGVHFRNIARMSLLFFIGLSGGRCRLIFARLRWWL